MTAPSAALRAWMRFEFLATLLTLLKDETAATRRAFMLLTLPASLEDALGAGLSTRDVVRALRVAARAAERCDRQLLGLGLDPETGALVANETSTAARALGET